MAAATYSGLFTELKRVVGYARKRHRRGVVDAATVDSLHRKLLAMCGDLIDQPLYRALVLVTAARLDHGGRRPLAEAGHSVLAGNLLLDYEARVVAAGAVTTQEHAAMALVLFDRAVEVYRQHEMNTEAGAVALEVADQLRLLGYDAPALDWYRLAADSYLPAGDDAPGPLAPPDPQSTIAPRPSPPMDVLLGAVHALEGIADLAALAGDLALVIDATRRLLGLLITESIPALETHVLQSGVTLLLALLVEKHHAAARGAMGALRAFVQEREPEAQDPPGEGYQRGGHGANAWARAIPLLQWLQEECESDGDVLGIEELAEELMPRVAMDGPRNALLLQCLVRTYRAPGYLLPLLAAGPVDPIAPSTI